MVDIFYILLMAKFLMLFKIIRSLNFLCVEWGRHLMHNLIKG